MRMKRKWGMRREDVYHLEIQIDESSCSILFLQYGDQEIAWLNRKGKFYHLFERLHELNLRRVRQRRGTK